MKRLPKGAVRITVRPVLYIAPFKPKPWDKVRWRVLDHSGKKLAGSYKSQEDAKEAAISLAIRLFRPPKDYCDKYAMKLRQWNQIGTDQLCKEPKD